MALTHSEEKTDMDLWVRLSLTVWELSVYVLLIVPCLLGAMVCFIPKAAGSVSPRDSEGHTSYFHRCPHAMNYM